MTNRDKNVRHIINCHLYTCVLRLSIFPFKEINVSFIIFIVVKYKFIQYVLKDVKYDFGKGLSYLSRKENTASLDGI